jgi:hypothetical protein
VKESTVEEYLVKQVELKGGICEKHVAPGRRDVPDRLVTWSWGAMDLVETKAPGKKPRAGQMRDHCERAKRGIPVYVLDTKLKVDRYVDCRAHHDHSVPLFSVPVTKPVFMVSYEYGRPPRVVV